MVNHRYSMKQRETERTCDSFNFYFKNVRGKSVEPCTYTIGYTVIRVQITGHIPYIFRVPVWKYLEIRIIPYMRSTARQISRYPRQSRY